MIFWRSKTQPFFLLQVVFLRGHVLLLHTIIYLFLFSFMAGWPVPSVSYLDPTDDTSHLLCRQQPHCTWSPCWTGECCTESKKNPLVIKETCSYLVFSNTYKQMKDYSPTPTNQMQIWHLHETSVHMYVCFCVCYTFSGVQWSYCMHLVCVKLCVTMLMSIRRGMFNTLTHTQLISQL